MLTHKYNKNTNISEKKITNNSVIYIYVNSIFNSIILHIIFFYLFIELLRALIVKYRELNYLQVHTIHINGENLLTLSVNYKFNIAL